MTYADAIRFLYDLRLFGLKLGLENTRRLAALAGNPQARLRFIHVAGTNGKGSTCAMLESVHRAAGRRVGLFTSPHLVSFRERLQVNRQPIGENEVVRLVADLQALLREFPTDHSPTFFEVVTVMALRWFAEQNCDLVIWETGLGGRLDATNIVTPLASVITNIQFDHMPWLGNTLAMIAAEKAGIVKPGVPVLTATDAPEALAVIRETAHALGAPLTEMTAAATADARREIPELPLLGEHQQLNAALALATVTCLQPALPVAAAACHAGLATVQWLGRLQVIPGPAGQQNLLDGAHNMAAVAALLAALTRHFPGRKPALIVGVLRDKEWAEMCRTLAPHATGVWFVPVANNRATTPAELRGACRDLRSAPPLHVCESLAEALAQTAAEPFRLIAGSLYLVGEALELLGAAPMPVNGERGLNEWAVHAPEKVVTEQAREDL
jgi:dihydrofolate synthase/folylpolyglutamate synthase